MPGPPVPSSFAYFVPEASEYFTGLARPRLAVRGIQYDGLVQRDPVNIADEPDCSAASAGPGSQPDPRRVQEPATIQGMADQYDLGYSQGTGTVEWVKANLGGTATIVSFILDHIEIPPQGTNDALAAGGITYELIEQELQKINADDE